MTKSIVHGTVAVGSSRQPINRIAISQFRMGSLLFRGSIWSVCGLLALFFFPRVVLANELDDFQQARQAYESQDYALSAKLFEDLIGGATPKLSNRALQLESRKYLGASYLFLGRFQDAEKEFGNLLREDKSYKLDPMAFPAEVQNTFNLVRQRLGWEEVQVEREKKRTEQLARQRDEEDAARKRQSLNRLAELAQNQTVERVNSRWIAMIPFGVGQYQNNHPNAGTFFLVTESSLLTLHIVSYFIHQDLEGQTPTKDKLGEARVAEKAFRYTNWISLGVFGVVVIAGIVDAQIRFNPKTTSERRRELPNDIRDTLKIETSGSDLTIRF
jgi:hypothetical protein